MNEQTISVDLLRCPRPPRPEHRSLLDDNPWNTFELLKLPELPAPIRDFIEFYGLRGYARYARPWPVLFALHKGIPVRLTNAPPTSGKVGISPDLDAMTPTPSELVYLPELDCISETAAPVVQAAREALAHDR